VPWMIETLCYKPKNSWFESRCNLMFSISIIHPAALGPGAYSASNRNEYQEQKNNVSGERSKALPALKADNFIVICEPIV
jgi:hypothetical protein